jgi:hypothetical protein
LARPWPHIGVSAVRQPALESHRQACENQSTERGLAVKTKKKTLTAGQRTYEVRRAAKAGMSLDKWLDTKQRQQEVEARARQKAAEPLKSPKKPGLISRLLQRAQRPLGS